MIITTVLADASMTVVDRLCGAGAPARARAEAHRAAGQLRLLVARPEPRAGRRFDPGRPRRRRVRLLALDQCVLFKKVENHAYAVALHCTFYNFVRIHKTLRVTPAMAAGLADRLWDVRDIVALVEAAEAAEGTKKRGPCRPRQSKAS